MAVFDVTMTNTVQDPDSPLYWGKIGGCAVTPPIRHALTHESGTRGRVMGMNKTSKQGLHNSRWHESWCVGGTRPVAGNRARTPERLVNMPRPEPRIVYGTVQLD